MQAVALRGPRSQALEVHSSGLGGGPEGRRAGDPRYPPGVGAGRGTPPGAGQENSVSASSAGLSKEELRVGVFFPNKEGPGASRGGT